MTAEKFGMCVCGRPRAEHSEAALAASVQESKGVGTTRQGACPAGACATFI